MRMDARVTINAVGQVAKQESAMLTAYALKAQKNVRVATFGSPFHFVVYRDCICLLPAGRSRSLRIGCRKQQPAISCNCR
jgi:hypothetical protein